MDGPERYEKEENRSSESSRNLMVQGVERCAKTEVYAKMFGIR